MVKIVVNGKIEAWALLDTGSTNSFICKSLADKWQLMAINGSRIFSRQNLHGFSHFPNDTGVAEGSIKILITGESEGDPLDKYDNMSQSLLGLDKHETVVPQAYTAPDNSTVW